MKMSDLIGYRIPLDFVKNCYCFNSEFLILEYVIVTYFPYGVCSFCMGVYYVPVPVYNVDCLVFMLQWVCSLGHVMFLGKGCVV
jgi:hypothetical protein